MKLNKRFALILSVVLCVSFIFGGISFAAEKRLRVVTTVFPVYDWVRQVTGNSSDVEIVMLLDSGVDLHSYQPTAADILKIATCDVFIYVGGESDEWVENALKEAVNPDLVIVNLLEALGDDVKTEEAVEGMEQEDDGDYEHEEHEEADEHVWLSLRNAQKLTGIIAEALGKADAAREDAYKKNAAAYTEKLADLDVRYASMVESAAYRTVLFGDRFPFRYLVDDYGLSYYAAFSGCSAETEASFQTIVFLAQKVNELNLPAVLTIEGTNHKIAETIIQTTEAKNQRLLTMNSMQGVIAADVQAGASYIGFMESNLEVLTDALN